MVMVASAKRKGVRIIGPGTIGVITPSKAVLGWVGSSAEGAKEIFQPGPVGILSRSGGQSGTLPWIIKNAGHGCRDPEVHEGRSQS